MAHVFEEIRCFVYGVSEHANGYFTLFTTFFNFIKTSDALKLLIFALVLQFPLSEGQRKV